jgi:NADH:ubiquinone oxidoreductase subunit 4 (subunit M)
MRDLRWEAAYLVPLIAAVLVLSVYPYAVTHRVSDSMHGIVSAVTAKAGP